MASKQATQKMLIIIIHIYVEHHLRSLSNEITKKQKHKWRWVFPQWRWVGKYLTIKWPARQYIGQTSGSS